MLEKILNKLIARAGTLQAATAEPESARAAADRLVAQGNLAENSGDPVRACEFYRQAITADPGYGKGHLNLGIGLEAAGDAEGALKSYEAALAIDAGEPYANYNLGKLLYTRGALEQAAELLRRALERKPDFPEARVVLAGILDAQGKPEAAAGELEAALRIQPLYFGALCNYAAVLRRLERPAEAVQALRRAAAIQPDDADLNYELGVLLRTQGELPDAERYLRLSVKANPRHPDAHAALSAVCKARGDLAAAAAELETVLSLRPDWFDAMFNYAVVLTELRRTAEAETLFRRVIAGNPGHFASYRMLGRVLYGQARLDEALDVYRTATMRFPDMLELASAELFMLCFSEDIADEALFARHKALGARLEAAYGERFRPLRNDPDPGRRLRVGYVSGDLHSHPVALFLQPVVERHDRAAFEVYCYSTGESEDAVTRQLAAKADVWRAAAPLSETELAELIHDDRIDILVDLAGHSGVPQLRVFAQRPAPVQATWLGYLNTTGMTRIHYRITDAHADPAGLTERYHTETLVRLPHSQWCYRPLLTVEPSAEPAFSRNGCITFGSFNQLGKISRGVRGLWARILEELPESRLMVLGVEEERAREVILEDFAAHGIHAGRISVERHLPLADYFRRYDAVDIALDTTPYSGGTTTCDTLWMGVPVITLAGSRPMSRSAASILAAVGLPEWTASTPQEYVKLAVDLSRDRDTIASLRRTLRGRMRASPMMDEAGFARDIEAAYRRMWAAWCERGF